MSAKKQEPKILGTTESQPEGFKWVRLKKIDWEDETGKKIAKHWKTAVAIIALLDHPSKPLSTVILEQYRPPIENTVIGVYAFLTPGHHSTV
ncbi:hypothetical protein QFC24_000846 [Naganishia onofrii]|uniref:Uncharacterized protein n=1 Tax=Naganishia onofrii TaxID=1851511 RepID=A0ACC2XU84_9TREE|nr:hypothetical protein QFC24_000846 [Naganishia onofrii]